MKDGVDNWGLWTNRLARRRNRILCAFWTSYMRLKCRYWKISLGKNCLFWGNMHFQRAHGSNISVGNDNRFRSSTWSNLIGVNRPCYLCTLRFGAKIQIGKGAGFTATVISAAQSITIGDNCLCGANVTITDTDWHHVDRFREPIGPPPSAPIVIGKNVWLGMNVVVLKGVTIGDNCVIAANSVVTKNIPSKVLAAGQPAIEIKQI